MEATTPTTTTMDSYIETSLKKFSEEVNEDSLKALVKEYEGLGPITDKASLAKVQSARKTLKKNRVAIQSYAKGLRESATAFNKAIIKRENELVGIVSPMEESFEAQERDWDEQQELLRQEEERKESERIQSRMDRLNSVNYGMDFHELRVLSDEAFEDVYAQAKVTYDKWLKEEEIRIQNAQLLIEEGERLAQIEKERRLAERNELEAKRKELEEKQKELELQELERAEKARLEQEEISKKQEQLQKELDERAAKIEAAELAIKEERDKKEAKERAKREAEAAKEKAKEEERERLLFGQDSIRFKEYVDALKVVPMLAEHMQSLESKRIAEEIEGYVAKAYLLAEVTYTC